MLMRLASFGWESCGSAIDAGLHNKGDQAMRKQSESSARGARAAKNGKRTARARPIDFSEIPEASSQQLQAMRRVGRPPLGKGTRRLIAIRLDPDVLVRFTKEAKRRKVGYQTLINRVLAEYVGKDVARVIAHRLHHVSNSGFFCKRPGAELRALPRSIVAWISDHMSDGEPLQEYPDVERG
jgi:uncharacterized protein (DUF4415 family)